MRTVLILPVARFALHPARHPYSGCFCCASGYLNYNDGVLNNSGNNGYYWSLTPNSNNNAYNLYFNNNGNVNPSNNNNRSNGYAVRCLQESIADTRFADGPFQCLLLCEKEQEEFPVPDDV